MAASRGGCLRPMATAGVIGVAVALAGPAVAQVAAGQADPAPAAEDPGRLEDIIVTAQHRSENLQDVPIAITAITSATLLDSGIDSSSALPQLVPSVQFTRSGPSGLFFVRGVGQTNAATGEEGSNAVYVDGVYMADLGQTVNYFNNIERIEVLKGPQGTLFGRNATGGLIHVITRDPGDTLTVRGQFGYANYETASGQLYVGGPVTDRLAVDVALTGSDQDKSWGRNLTTGRPNALAKYWGVRSKAVYRPMEGVKFTLAGDYFRDSDSTVLAYDLDPAQVGTGGTRYVPGRDNRSNLAPITKREIYGGSLTGEVDAGFANLTTITAYRENDTRSVVDIDGGPLPLINIALHSRSKTFTQEARLASTGSGPFSWQGGGFYLHNRATNYQVQNGVVFTALGLGGFLIDAAQVTDSYAGFGEVTYAVTPTTHLTGGIRYTHETRRFEGGRSPLLLSGALGPLVTQPNPRLSYDEVTYRVSLRQDITDDINAYASVNRGFKAGLFSLQGPTDPPVKPQFIMAYEVGFKSQLFDRRLRLNVAAYHYDIDALQIRSGAGATPGASVLLNAAKAKVDGFEADFEAAPTGRLRFFGGFNILNSRFTRFGGPGAAFQAPITYPNFSPVRTTCPASLIGTANPGVVGSGTLSGGLTTCFGDVSGNRTALSPKFAGSLGASYTLPLAGESELRLTALYSYNSGYVFEPDNVYGQGAFSLVNGSIEYRINPKWAVEIWGRNLTNKTYYAQELTSATGTTTILAPPRTYGANVKIGF